MTMKLRKSDTQFLDGVCSGIADYINVVPTLFRMGLCIIALTTSWSMAITYIILMICMPEAEETE